MYIWNSNYLYSFGEELDLLQLNIFFVYTLVQLCYVLKIEIMEENIIYNSIPPKHRVPAFSACLSVFSFH